jgi:hypothetical protein
MTPRARDGQRHRPAADDVDPVVDDVRLVVQEPPAQRQETERRQRPLVGLRLSRADPRRSAG